jgi:small subunit ribosomal protein S6
MKAATSSRAREYETIYVLNPTTPAEEASRVASRLSEVIGKLSGKVTRVDNWGVRRLAYPVAKSSRGNFTYLKYVGYNDVVAEVERNLRMLDAVVRFQTTLVRRDVDVSELKINPEDVTFKASESNADDNEPTLEQKLGFVQDPRHHRNHDHYADEIEASAVDQTAVEATKAEDESKNDAASDATAAVNEEN